MIVTVCQDSVLGITPPPLEEQLAALVPSAPASEDQASTAPESATSKPFDYRAAFFITLAVVILLLLLIVVFAIVKLTRKPAIDAGDVDMCENRREPTFFVLNKI